MISGYSLPQDIWDEIFDYLDTKTVLNLRLIQKPFNNIVKQSRICRKWIDNKYFYQDYIIKANYMPKLTNNYEYFDYFIKRCRKDEEISIKIEEIFNSQNSLQKVWDFLETYKEFELSPLLYKKIQILNNNISLKLKNLEKFNFYKTVLDALRSEKIFKLIKTKGQSAIDFEDFFLILSFQDPSFDDLLPFRSSIINKVIKSYSNYIDNKFLTNTEKVIYLIRIFKNLTNKASKHFSNSLEDFFILRIYNGEVYGINFLNNVIIAKIASILGIEVYLETYYLEIIDETFKNGKSFVFITDYNHKILTESELHDSFKLKTTRYDWLKFIFSNNYSVVFNEEDFQSSYRKIDNLKFQFYSDFFKLTENYNTVHKKQFSKNLNTYYYFYLPFLKKYWPVSNDFDKIKKNIINNYQENILTELDIKPSLNHPQKVEFKTGDIIYHERRSRFGIIIGYKIINDQSEIFYNVYLSSGKIEIYDQSGLKTPKFDNEIIMNLIKNEFVGVFFTSYNEFEKKFIPTKLLSKAYPNL